MYTIIASTNRKGSNTLRLAEIYKSFLEARGETTEIISMMELPDDVIVSDLYGKRTDQFQVLQKKIQEAQKFIFIIPEYNGSFPGTLKIFIDCLEYPGSFSGKKAALVGLSSGTYGNIRGLDHFTGICHYVGLNLLPLKIHIPYIKKEFEPDGMLKEGPALQFIHQQIHEFILF